MSFARISPADWYSMNANQQTEFIRRKAEYENWLAKPLTGHDYPYLSVDEPKIKPEPKRTGMNYSTAVFLINNNVRAVRGTYQQDGTSAIFKTLDPDVAKDDLVVVPTSTRHGMTAFKITEVDIDVDMDSATHVDWIVCRIDQEPYKKVVAEEADAISKIKSAELRKKRTDLAEALFKDNIDTLKALPIATSGDKPAA